MAALTIDDLNKARKLLQENDLREFPRPPSPKESWEALRAAEEVWRLGAKPGMLLPLVVVPEGWMFTPAAARQWLDLYWPEAEHAPHG